MVDIRLYCILDLDKSDKEAQLRILSFAVNSGVWGSDTQRMFRELCARAKEKRPEADLYGWAAWLSRLLCGLGVRDEAEVDERGGRRLVAGCFGGDDTGPGGLL